MNSYIDRLCSMTDSELVSWIEALEIECDGLEDGCTRLSMARTALANRRTYTEE
jgi:hypothetical protein